MRIETNILVVDDDPGVLTGIKIVLEHKISTAKVICTQSGREALSLMRQRIPDLVLLDIMMPDMNGWDVTAEMRSDDALKEVPIIYVTRKKDALSRQAGMMNAEAYITKPFEGEELINIIVETLNKSQKRRAKS